jgi:hypothetical protein
METLSWILAIARVRMVKMVLTSKTAILPHPELNILSNPLLISIQECNGGIGR